MLAIRCGTLLKYNSDHSVSCIKLSAVVEYKFHARPGSVFVGQNKKSGLLGRAFPMGHSGGEASAAALSDGASVIVWN